MTEIVPDDLTSDQIMERTLRHWDYSGPLPIPIGEFTCFCGGTDWHARYWLFHDYAIQRANRDHRFRYRCDVSLKCMDCGHTPVWGLVIPDEHWAKWGLSPRKVDWHEALPLLDGQLTEAPEGLAYGFGPGDIPINDHDALDLDALADAFPHEESGGWDIKLAYETQAEEVGMVLGAAARLLDAPEIAIMTEGEGKWKTARFALLNQDEQPIGTGVYRMVKIRPRTVEHQKLLTDPGPLPVPDETPDLPD